MPSPNADAINSAMNRLHTLEQNKVFCESAIDGESLPDGLDVYDVYMKVCRDDPEMFVLTFLGVVKERNQLDGGRVAAESALDTLLLSNVGISLDFLYDLMDESVRMALREKKYKERENMKNG
jgi:hypothetical protein